jgi:hypothetical protein
MFGAGIWNVEWLNANSQRNYPISEEATLKDTTGTFTIPLDFIVDIVWPVQASASINADKFHISNISVFGNGVTLTIAYDGTAIGSVSIANSTHQTNQSYFISGTGNFYDSVGKVTIGSISKLITSGGSYNFDIAGGRLEPTVIRPNLKGVSSMLVVNGTETSQNLIGDVEFESGRNIQFTVTQPSGGNPRIRIDATGTAAGQTECDCGNEAANGTPIKTINGVPPDEFGNIQLVSDDECMLIDNTGEATILFTDQCSKSCCGCAELDAIVNDLNLLDAEVNTMDGILSRLDAQVATAITNLLSSKTNEKPST